MTTALTPRRLLVAGLLFFLACAALAGTRPLGVPDEGRYAEVAREMVVTGDFITPRLNFVPFLDKPPLFTWLEALALAAFGATPFAARLATSLLGAIGCTVVLAAGARLSGWRAGLLGAVTLLGTLLWYGGAQYVNHDLAVATWITASTLALALAALSTGRGRLGWLLAGGVASGLAVLTKGLIGVVFPFGIVGLWLLLTRRWRFVPWLLLPFGLGVLVATPWFLACQAANPEFFHYFFVTQHFERFAGTGFNNPMGPGFYPVILILGLLPWTPFLPSAAARAWRGWRADPDDRAADLLLLLWPLVVVAFFSIPRSKIVGYVLPAVPPLAMLVGRWWGAWHEGATPPRRALSFAAGGAMGLVGVAVMAVPFVLPLVEPGRPPVPTWSTVLLVATGLLLLLVTALALAALLAGAAGRSFVLLTAFAGVLLAGAGFAVPGVVDLGTDRLAEKLRPLLRDGDAVVAYRQWFYDLPMALDRREPILTVDDWDDPAIARRDDWRRELWLGRGWRPGSSAWLIGREAMVARCGAGRCFVIARRDRVAELGALLPVVELAAQGRSVLLVTAAVDGR